MQKALVTGGNRGIGRAIAAGLVEAGLDVVIGSRDLEMGQAVAAEIGANAVQLDVTNPADIDAAAEGITVLVNNAGVIYSDTNVFDDADQYRNSMEVMLNGPYALIRACLPSMKAAGYGRIVNVSSGLGAFSVGIGGGGAYGVAKAALNALTQLAPRDLPDFVKINTMSPGMVKTRMGPPNADRTPEEGADTAIWLATLPDNGPTGGFFRDRRPAEW